MLENNSTPIDFYLELINNMPHSVVVTDRDRRIIFCNKILKPTFGENIENILKDTWQDTFQIYTIDKKHKYGMDDLPIAKAIQGEVLVGQKMFIKGDKCKDGMYVKMCAYPIIYQEDQITVIIFEDITEEQKIFDAVMDKLIELEQYLRQKSNIEFKNK